MAGTYGGRKTVIRLTLTAMFMALNIVLSSFSVPVPGGHLYLNDVAICFAAILLNPFEAFVVGGIGAFLGDLFFYPAPMFVSLVVHGLQAVVISLFAHYIMKKHPVVSSGIGVTIGAIIMVVGYTFGRVYIYGVGDDVSALWVGSIAKLPFQCLQAGVGAVLGMILAYPSQLRKVFQKIVGEKPYAISK